MIVLFYWFIFIFLLILTYLICQNYLNSDIESFNNNSDIGSESGVNSGVNSGINSGSGSVIGSGNGSVIGSGNGSVIGSDTGSIIGSDTGSIIGSDTGSIIGSGNGSIIGSGNGSIIGSGNGSGINNNENGDYNLTLNSVELDNTYDIFEDTTKYIKAPKSDKCFEGQYSRSLLNPGNPVLPQVYFTEENKTQSRIINVDVFKSKILDKILDKYSDSSIGKLEYTEPTNKLSYYDNTELYTVNEDNFNIIMTRIKEYIDVEFKNYIQTTDTDASDIKCLKDMSNCDTYLWNPGIIRIRKNNTYYEYIAQMTYYIQGKAYAYVLLTKFYIGINNVESGNIYINELNLMGLESEQNIMLNPGYSKTQLDNKLNIYTDFPYTPYEADMTYYRSSNEDTFLRDLFMHGSGSGSGTSEFDINEEAIQELLDERDELQEEVQQVAGICMTSDGDVLNYDTKDECESAVDEYGNSKEAGIFYNMCEENTDCPYYLANTNYENERGGCQTDGFCELPINIKQLSYTDYYDEATYYPHCHGCPTDKMETCCDIQEKILNGTATNEEIEEHGLTNVELSSPDYAFEDDFDERLKYQTELNEKNIEIN